MTRITLKRERNCWTATFQGSDMPQDMPLPLPWAPETSVLTVAKDIRTRFAGAMVYYIAMDGMRHHAA